jgi:hypothetical protein
MGGTSALHISSLAFLARGVSQAAISLALGTRARIFCPSTVEAKKES